MGRGSHGLLNVVSQDTALKGRLRRPFLISVTAAQGTSLRPDKRRRDGDVSTRAGSGGAGYVWESEINRLYHATKLLEIGAGTIEVVLAEIEQGRGVLGVVDGFRPRVSRTNKASNGATACCGRSAISSDERSAFSIERDRTTALRTRYCAAMFVWRP